jgi:hypothetical protein
MEYLGMDAGAWTASVITIGHCEMHAYRITFVKLVRRNNPLSRMMELSYK